MSGQLRLCFGNVIRTIALACLGGILTTPSVGQTIVWTDQNARTIQRKDANGGSVETIVQFQAPQTASLLDYDPLERKIYYVLDPGEEPPFFQRSNLDGSDAESIPTPTTGSFSLNVELRKLYWLESFLGDSFGYSDLDGTGAGSHTYPFCCVLSLEAKGNTLFLGTGGPVGKGVWRSAADGSNPQFLHANVDPVDLAYDPVEDDLYLATDDVIARMEPDGSSFQVILSSPQTSSPAHVEIDSQRRKVYWIDEGGVKVIKRANLDGSNVENFVTRDNVGNPNFEPRGLAIVPDPTPIPALSEWGVVLMAALIVVCAAWVLRKGGHKSEERSAPQYRL